MDLLSKIRITRTLALILCFLAVAACAWSQSMEAQAYYREGRKQFRNKNYRKAIDDLEKALAKDPGYLDAYWLLGLSYRMEKNAGKARECFLKIVKKNRKFIPAYLELADIAVAEGKLDEAEAQLKECIKQCPSSPYGHYGFGVLKYRQGKPAEAVQSWEKAILKDKQFAPAHYCLGVAKYNDGRFNEAVQLLNRADELEKRKNQLTHFTLGWVYRRLGKAQFAKDCFDEARGLSVESAIGRTVDALRLIEQGKQESAVPILEKVLEEDPTQDRARYLLGKCREAAGEWEKAQETYREILKNDPQDLDCLESLKVLENTRK